MHRQHLSGAQRRKLKAEEETQAKKDAGQMLKFLTVTGQSQPAHSSTSSTETLRSTTNSDMASNPPPHTSSSDVAMDRQESQDSEVTDSNSNVNASETKPDSMSLEKKPRQ